METHIAPPGYLDADTYAKTTTIRECDGTIIGWEWFIHEKTGKIPFLIREDVLGSDEAIVAVIGHEMYELERLRILPSTVMRFLTLGGRDQPSQ